MMSFLKSVGKVVKQVDKAVGDIRNSNIANTALDAVSAMTGGGNNGGVVSGAVGSGDSSSSSWITSLMNTAGNFLNSGLGTLSDVLQNKYNIEKQKELAQYQADQQLRLNQDAFNKNLEMWNMENAYNSPAEQMKRFEAAGLNKNLIYGQSNTAGSGPTFEAPKFDVGQYNSVDNRMQRAQLALAMEQHHAQIKNQQIENAMKLQSIHLAERNADREDKLADAQIQALKSNLGIRYDKLALDKSQPKSWLGKMWSDVKGTIAPDVGKGLVQVAKVADKTRGSYDYPAYLQRRVDFYNNSKRKYIKGIHY